MPLNDLCKTPGKGQQDHWVLCFYNEEEEGHATTTNTARRRTNATTQTLLLSRPSLTCAKPPRQVPGCEGSPCKSSNSLTCIEATFEPKCKRKCDSPCEIPHCDMETEGECTCTQMDCSTDNVCTIERVLQRRPLPRGNNMTKDQRMPPDAHQVLYSAKCQSSTCVNKDISCTTLSEQQQQERFAFERLCEAEEKCEE